MKIFCISVASDILTEFLEVAFHSLLYVRDLYPCGVFQRRKKYDVPIYVSTIIQYTPKIKIWDTL